MLAENKSEREKLRNRRLMIDSVRHTCLNGKSCSGKSTQAVIQMDRPPAILNKDAIFLTFQTPISGLEPQSKTQIRTTLASILLERNDALKYFVKNKLAKLLVDVGRHDWPHFYPDFMENIFSLIQSPSTTLLGLILLQVGSLICFF